MQLKKWTCAKCRVFFFCSKKIRPLDEINAAIIMLVINWGGENVGQPTFIGKNEQKFLKRGCSVCISR